VGGGCVETRSFDSATSEREKKKREAIPFFRFGKGNATTPFFLKVLIYGEEKLRGFLGKGKRTKAGLSDWN